WRSRASSSGQLTRVSQRSKTRARGLTRASCPRRVLGRFRLARVDPELEQPPQALARLRLLEPEADLDRSLGPGELQGVFAPTPAVAAEVALVLAERPQPLHVSHGTTGAGCHGEAVTLRWWRPRHACSPSTSRAIPRGRGTAGRGGRG